MKTPIEYIIAAVPFHADAATHDELARKVNEKLSGWVRTIWGTISQRGNDVPGNDEVDPAKMSGEPPKGGQSRENSAGH